MRVLIIKPLEVPVAKDISGTLESMQETVGGLIQAVYPFEDSAALICNDEGKLMNLPMNRYVPEIRDVICGTFFLCNAPPDAEHFTSLTEEQIKQYTQRFAIPELFLLRR